MSSRFAVALALMLAMPAAGLFCWQWATQTSSPDGSQAAASSQSPLLLKQDLPSRLVWPGKTSANLARPLLNAPASGNLENPWYSGSRPGMLAALRDPFHESLASGISQGPLVVKSRGRGIPTYRTPMAARRSASRSDRAILGEIQQGVGGSFSNFLSNVFGSTQGKEGGVPGEVAEENPFSKPADAAAPDQAANNSAAPEPKPEIKAAAKSAPDPAPAQPQAEPAPAAPGRLATAVRPDILLHVGEAGQLQSVPAVVLNENTIETAELGMQKVNMLTFANPTEIPVAIAVADFNSDSIPDIGFVDGRAGLLRLLYGDSEGAYVEAMRVEVGGGARSLVSGDFNGDGRTDLAISNVGIGAITV
jgi:hypothetical protein